MLALAGWWSIYLPWDFEAFLHYRPVELVWFLLKHINSPFRVGISLDTAGAAVTLMDVRALGGRNLFFVDVGQWKVALNGIESAALIPVICQVLYNY